MTKKHYEAAARQVREMQCVDSNARLLVAQEFAEFFKRHNERFDEEMFFAACFPKPAGKQFITV